MKTFSVLIAHYNNFEYFKDCYKSLLLQTYKDFEVLAHKNRLNVVDSFGLREGQVIRTLPNLRASTAVFCLERG